MLLALLFDSCNAQRDDLISLQEIINIFSVLVRELPMYTAKQVFFRVGRKHHLLITEEGCKARVFSGVRLCPLHKKPP